MKRVIKCEDEFSISSFRRWNDHLTHEDLCGSVHPRVCTVYVHMVRMVQS